MTTREIKAWAVIGEKGDLRGCDSSFESLAVFNRKKDIPYLDYLDDFGHKVVKCTITYTT